MTTTSHAVLGLLSIRPWTTYELATQVERSLHWFWPRTPRKIYDEAKRLVAAGYAVSHDEMVGRRPRTVYEVTPAGRDALAGWLGERSAAPKFESEAMVRVFFADGGSLEDLRTTLTETAAAADARVAVLATMVEALAADDYAFADRRPINALALRFHVDHQRHLADWARWALAQTASWRSPTDPGDWDWRAVFA